MKLPVMLVKLLALTEASVETLEIVRSPLMTCKFGSDTSVPLNEPSMTIFPSYVWQEAMLSMSAVEVRVMLGPSHCACYVSSLL